jgi:hypothetical protein
MKKKLYTYNRRAFMNLKFKLLPTFSSTLSYPCAAPPKLPLRKLPLEASSAALLASRHKKRYLRQRVAKQGDFHRHLRNANHVVKIAPIKKALGHGALALLKLESVSLKWWCAHLRLRPLELPVRVSEPRGCLLVRQLNPT